MAKAAGRHVARRWFPGVGRREVVTSAGSIGAAAAILLGTVATAPAARPAPVTPPPPTVTSPPPTTSLPPPSATSTGEPTVTRSGTGAPAPPAPPSPPPPSVGPAPTTPPTIGPTIGSTVAPTSPPTAPTAGPTVTTIRPRNKASGLVRRGVALCVDAVDHGIRIQQPCHERGPP